MLHSLDDGVGQGEAGQRTWNVVAVESFHLQFKDLFLSFFIDRLVFLQLMHTVFFQSCHLPSRGCLLV